jgi:hypothetical protein
MKSREDLERSASKWVKNLESGNESGEVGLTVAHFITESIDP